MNAVNARWGSLYDAIYGTDVLGRLPTSSKYDSIRGKSVVEYTKSYLDKILPLIKGSWKDVSPKDYALNDYHDFLKKNHVEQSINLD